ncbi:hypothetical protein K2F54_16125 [Cryobacterium sp. 1639]|uniref:hypothetical protein n=1 Tax=Cryobacterium inferilacus TaxID=2866629 RepID=UPI001C73D6E5|nr:hypothetical protein [Cryobacterium sp. 1639]MBX0301502.1 hypothetical protein [Cryobacterium sp. 1639]
MTDATQHTRVPLARIVDEGLLIALSSVRMAVKNDIIVSGLAEHADFDPARFAATTRRELLALAEENRESAIRVARQRKDLKASTWRLDLSDDQQMDIRQFKKRTRVHKKLAGALTGVADDDDQIVRLVQEAKNAASAEVQDAMRTRLLRLSIDPSEPDYQLHRAERTEMFLLVDLALLRLKADAAAGDGDDGY